MRTRVLGKSRQGCVGVMNNISALTNFLTSKAILVLPSTGLSNYEQLFVIETVHTIQLVSFGFIILCAS